MKKDSFAKKLAGYIAMSSAFLAAAKESEAQIIYTDINPDFYDSNGYFSLDLNNDGVVDFQFNALTNIFTYSTSYSYWEVHSHEFLIECIGSNKVVIDSVPLPKALIQSDNISVNNDWGSNQVLYKYSGFVGNWDNSTEKFAGLKLKIGTTNYYGWVRVIVDGAYLKIKDYAFNNFPEHSIQAGQVDCNNSTNIIATPSNIGCEGQHITLQLSSGNFNSVTWYKGTAVISYNQSVWAIVSGDYYAIIHHFTCVDTTESVNLIFNPSPAIPIITQQNDSLFTTNISGYSYQWFFGTYPIPNSDNYFLVPQWLGSYHVTATNQYGCSASSGQYYLYPLNSNSIASISENLIFTNDQNQLNLIFLPDKLTGGEIKIFDLNGKLLIEKKQISSTEQIPLNNFSSGIYFFEIRKNELVVRRKFFVN